LIFRCNEEIICQRRLYGGGYYDSISYEESEDENEKEDEDVE
jgi:hypothetical protein